MRDGNTKPCTDFRFRWQAAPAPRESCRLHADNVQPDQQQSQGDTTRSGDTRDQAHSKNYLSHSSLSKRATEAVCKISWQAPDAIATDPRFN